MASLIWSFVARYGLSVFLTIAIYNQLDSYPPISWFDKDQRTISKLTNDKKSLEETIAELVEEKSLLTVKIEEQNSAVKRLKEANDKKEASNKALSRKLSKELNDLDNDIQNRDLDINSCQDAIDYIIGVNND